jgi:glutamate dehydrogenase/leucine dehydrogenase
LREALRHGYRVTRCYRIWKYDKFENLFKEYVQTFMKMKIESSGFPADIQTDEQKISWAKGKI